jgi:hypothetical protein
MVMRIKDRKKSVKCCQGWWYTPVIFQHSRGRGRKTANSKTAWDR